MGIKITGTLDPGGGDYGILDDVHIIGGLRIVSTQEDRDSIPDLRRKPGMVVYVQENNKYYLLEDGDWKQLFDVQTQKLVGYSTEFTQADLEDGILVVEHNLNLKNNVGNVAVRDNDSKLFEPDDVIFEDENTLKVDLRSSEPIPGVWALVISGVSGDE